MRTVAFVTALLLSAPVAYADMVRWVDERGQVHYTDEPGNVPLDRRDSAAPVEFEPVAEPTKAPTTDAYRISPDAPAGPIVYEAPLVARGFSYYVDTTLNVNVRAQLLLDTGATFTIVSPEVGKKMGYDDLTKLPKMPVSTAGGSAWVYLIRIHRLSAGTATVEDIEGGISETMGPGMDGLLGGSFLNEYVYQIDGSGLKLTMKPNRDNRELYGGRDRKWWGTKYDHYVRAIRHYREMKQKMLEGVSPAEDSDMRAAMGLTPADMQKIIDYYEDLHVWLERRATMAKTPKEWREYP